MTNELLAMVPMEEERLKAFAGSDVHERALVILWIVELEQLLAAKHGRR